MRTKDYKKYSSHLPLLIRIVTHTTGDVLELGTGIFSTPVLHWLCFPDKRTLVSYESNQEYYEMIKQYSDDFHTIIKVDDFDEIDIERPWDVVFIDHEEERRKIEAERVANYAKFVILHDSGWRDEKYYHYKEIYHLYKYIYQFNLVRPRTKVMSNFVDVKELGLW